MGSVDNDRPLPGPDCSWKRLASPNPASVAPQVSGSMLRPVRVTVSGKGADSDGYTGVRTMRSEVTSVRKTYHRGTAI